MLALLPALLLAAEPALDARDEVRAADVGLDLACSRRDAEAFGALVEDGAVFGSAGGLTRGRDAVLAAWKPFFAEDGPRLRWTPQRAEAAASGDLGFTTGRFTFTARGKDGEAVRDEGAYATVWRRGASGTFRVLLDAPLEPAGKLGEGLVRTPVVSATSSAGDLEAVVGTWTRGVDEGGYLVVRRRNPAGAWEILVDSAFPFRHRPAR